MAEAAQPIVTASHFVVPKNSSQAQIVAVPATVQTQPPPPSVSASAALAASLAVSSPVAAPSLLTTGPAAAALNAIADQHNAQVESQLSVFQPPIYAALENAVSTVTDVVNNGVDASTVTSVISQAPVIISAVEGVISDVRAIRIQKLKDAAKELGEVTIKNLPTIVAKLMEIIEHDKSLTGVFKKEVVIDAITQIVDDSTVSAEEKAQINLFIHHAVSPMIDVIVAATNGNLHINNIEAMFKEASGCCVAGGKKAAGKKDKKAKKSKK